MVYVFLADGFEEIEAITPIDLLQRAGIKVTIVGIGSTTPTGSHGISVMADISDDLFFPKNDIDAIVLPGGMPGTRNLEASDTVKRAAKLAFGGVDITVAAICAAPMILAHLDLLKEKKATVYPTFKDELGDNYVTDDVVYDAPYLTASSAGHAIDFSLKLIEIIKGKPAATAVAESICYKNLGE
ncbi:MAG: DJ-1/PfpI family protein [Oscillospiraceae bacterium]